MLDQYDLGSLINAYRLGLSTEVKECCVRSITLDRNGFTCYDCIYAMHDVIDDKFKDCTSRRFNSRFGVK